MSFAIRQAWPSDLERLVALAVDCQTDPDRACPSLSDDAESITVELTEIDGAEDWCSVTWVALDDDRNVLGWIAAESDADMGRIWWFGPFLAGESATDPGLTMVPDGLYRIASAAMADFEEQQLAVDARSTRLPAFAERVGFIAEEGSVALRAQVLDVAVPETSAMIRALDGFDEEAAALHDLLFPGTHSTGSFLFAADGGDDGGGARVGFDRFVARLDGAVIGYVATDVQRDGSLYVDFLGVDPAHRGTGVGRVLIATALSHRADTATHAHLTVRTSNESARRLYASLGFVDDVVLIPYRRGFTLD